MIGVMIGVMIGIMIGVMIFMADKIILVGWKALSQRNQKQIILIDIKINKICQFYITMYYVLLCIMHFFKSRVW